MIEIIFEDKYFVICQKEPGQDSERQLPESLGAQLGSAVYTVHRLDVPTGGAICYAKSKEAAAAFSRLIEKDGITKHYLASIDGAVEGRGEMRDFLFRDKRKNKSYVVKRERKGVKEAILTYEALRNESGKTLVKIRLITGRTHQIRAQFASRKLPLTGDGKYGSRDNGCEAALWSYSVEFAHPFTKEPVKAVSLPPETIYPWKLFYSK